MYRPNESQLNRADTTRAMQPELAQKIVAAFRELGDAQGELDRLRAERAARTARIESRIAEVETELGAIDCDELDRAWGLTMARSAIGEAGEADVDAAVERVNRGYRNKRRLEVEMAGLRTLMGQMEGIYAVSAAAERVKGRQEELYDLCWPEVKPCVGLYWGPHESARLQARREWDESIRRHRRPISAIVSHAESVLAQAEAA